MCSNDPTLASTISTKALIHFFDFFKQNKEVPTGGFPTVHHSFLLISGPDFNHFQLQNRWTGIRDAAWSRVSYVARMRTAQHERS